MPIWLKKILQYQWYDYTQLTCTSWSKYSVAYSIMELWLALSFDSHTLYQRHACRTGMQHSGQKTSIGSLRKVWLRIGKIYAYV